MTPHPHLPTAAPPVTPRVLGLDPGLHVTGYAVLEFTDAGPKVCEAGVIRSADGRDPADMAARVRVLYDGLLEVVHQWKPTAMAVEQLFSHYDHPRTAVLMAHARGVFLLVGSQCSIPVASYAPARVKKLITGNGRAGKEQMQHAVAREFGLPAPPEPHDVADALAIALCHYHAATGRGVTGGARAVTFTGVNRAALLGDDPDVLDTTDDAA
jgi:crossover junction endodeoxyribonuclease RuvC